MFVFKAAVVGAGTMGGEIAQALWSAGAHTLVVPNGSLLPWKLVDGVKVFHLRAEAFKHEIAPGLEIEAWGYNKSFPGPLIEATEGDRVRIWLPTPERRDPAPEVRTCNSRLS